MSKPVYIEWEGRRYLLRSSESGYRIYMRRIADHAPNPMAFRRDLIGFYHIATNNEGHCPMYGVFYDKRNSPRTAIEPVWAFIDRSPKRITEPDITAQLLLLHGVTRVR